MIKTQVIIDGNYLLMKNVFILHKLRAIQDLESLMVRDIERITTSFPFDKSFFVSDSRESNWRKVIYQEYKGKRKKDINIDWGFVFQVYDELKQKINKKPNIKLLEYPGLEGDDFIAHIVKTSNKKNISNVILASDGDLQQLLDFDLNNKWINVQWNYRFSDERLYLPENFQLLLESLNNVDNGLDVLFSGDADNEVDFALYIEYLIGKTKIATRSPEKVIFEKIVQGDTSDNIPSIIKIKAKKLDPEGRGIGETGAIKLYNLYKEINPEVIDFDSDEFVEKLIDATLYFKKLKSDFHRDVIKANIISNRLLIYLDTKYMPSPVLNNMINHYEMVDNKEYEHVYVDQELLLEENGFFDEKPDELGKEFTMEKTAEDFNPDDFWEI